MLTWLLLERLEIPPIGLRYKGGKCFRREGLKSPRGRNKGRKTFMPKEHLVTFHITERTKDKMLSLIKFRKEYDNLPRYMKDALLSVSHIR